MGEIEQLRAALADARQVADDIVTMSDGAMCDGDGARLQCRLLIERIDALMPPDAPRTVSELPEVVQGEQAIEVPEGRGAFLTREQLDSLVSGNWAEPLEIDVEFPSGTWDEIEAQRPISELSESFTVTDSNLDIPLGTMVDLRAGDRPIRTTLTAAEVTEPGWYWYRWEELERGWMVVEVRQNSFGSFDVWLAGENEPIWIIRSRQTGHVPGTFIGPLRAPE